MYSTLSFHTYALSGLSGGGNGVLGKDKSECVFMNYAPKRYLDPDRNRDITRTIQSLSLQIFTKTRQIMSENPFEENGSVGYCIRA